MINIESICEQCLKKDGCQTYKELKEVTEIYLVDACEKYIKDVNAVLEQIRFEIEALPRELPTDARNMVRRTRVLDIIDKYTKGADA